LKKKPPIYYAIYLFHKTFERKRPQGKIEMVTESTSYARDTKESPKIIKINTFKKQNKKNRTTKTKKRKKERKERKNKED